jgi:diketogulonate reductase-like aldo/keto reductase
MMLLTFPGTAGVDPKDEKNIENRHDAWKVLEEFVLKGTIKSIGVANFKPRHLEKLLEIAWVKPVVNQIELHPLYIEHDTVDLCN